MVERSLYRWLESTSVGALLVGALLMAWLLSGCADSPGGSGTVLSDVDPVTGSPPAGGTIDFATQVQPIFDRNCSCHLTVSAPQGEVLQAGSSYDSMVNVPSTEQPSILRVKPGEPDNSYLVIKIDDNVPDVSSRRSGDRMPRGRPPLTPGEIDIIRQWIAEGALRTAVAVDTEPPLFDGATLAAPVSATSIDLFWDDALDDQTESAGLVYKVFMATSSGAHDFSRVFLVAPGQSFEVRVHGLEPATRYYFVVRAEDAAGNQDTNRHEVSVRTGQSPAPPDSVDFDTDVLPIFRQNCVRCHGSFGEGACSGIQGLCFDSFEAFERTAIDGVEIVPFDSAGSELVKRIRGISLPRMPFDGPPFLSEEEISIIEVWIDAGARPSEPVAQNRAPSANPGGGYTAEVGVPLNFSGSGSFDPDGDPLSFEWDFGDGFTGSGETLQHTYTEEGEYTLTLRVSDGELLSNPVFTSVRVVRQGLFVRNPTMERICSQCHGIRIVLDDGTSGELTPPGEGMAFFPPGFFMDCNIRSAQGWSDTVSRMRNVNGCSMTDEEEEEIVDFLSANYAGGDPRAEIFTRVCSQCHSPGVPLSVPRSPGDWSKTVDRMIHRYEASVSTAERTAIIGYLSTVARGEPPEELPEAEGRIYMNLVCSTCHSPGRALKDSTGLPKFDRFDKALKITRKMTKRGCGLKGVTDVIIANWLATADSSLPDILNISRYTYSGGTVEVRAWSSSLGWAVLTVTGEDGFEEVMENLGDGDYRLKVKNVDEFPGRITVRSSSGGALKWHRKDGEADDDDDDDDDDEIPLAVRSCVHVR